MRWDEVPPLSEDLARADEAIRRRVELIEEVALTTQGKKLLSRGAVGAAVSREFVNVHRRKWESGLCQNCVRYAPKPRSNTVIYGDTPMHIWLLEVVDKSALIRAGARC